MEIKDFPMAPYNIAPQDDPLFEERMKERNQRRIDRISNAKKDSKGDTIFNPYFKVEDVLTLKKRIAQMESSESKEAINIAIKAKHHVFREELPALDTRHPFMVFAL